MQDDTTAGARVPVCLRTETARLEVLPEIGAAVGRYDVRHEGGWAPIFQTAPTASRSGPFAQGCNILAPWSNRISGGGFAVDGRFHALQPNLAGEPYPNHGNAFSSSWQLDTASDASATLSLRSDGPGPFRYDGHLTYALTGSALTMTLTLVNRADIALPFGGGFHPWFVRTPHARLTMGADGYWTERADHLPQDFVALEAGAQMDFRHGAALPAGWINSAFIGWTGEARLAWPERRLAVEIAAEPPLTTLVLYSPGAGADFISIEPVSHSVDAHNRHGPNDTPPRLLAPGESTRLATTITPRPA